MSSHNPTFEEVNEHIEKADLSAFQGGETASTRAAAASIPNVCGAYKIVKPILQLVANLPLIPKKWKDVIKIFMQAMEAFCPSE